MRIPENVVSAFKNVLSSCKAQRLEKRSKNAILYPTLDSQSIRLPAFGHKVAAGFPSPADDYIEGRLSLDEHLIGNKESTFFVRAQGNSMISAGIYDGYLLVVNMSNTPTSGKIVIAIIDGDLT